jgi:hypothetical protein
VPRINDRHSVSRIRPNAPVKAQTTYIPPDLEPIVVSELADIAEGRAIRTQGNRYTVTSGRIYVDEGNDVFFPLSGPGLIGPVNRGANRALTIFARYNGPNEQAMHQIRLEKGVQPADVETALRIWLLLERD